MPEALFFTRIKGFSILILFAYLFYYNIYTFKLQPFASDARHDLTNISFSFIITIIP